MNAYSAILSRVNLRCYTATIIHRQNSSRAVTQLSGYFAQGHELIYIVESLLTPNLDSLSEHLSVSRGWNVLWILEKLTPPDLRVPRGRLITLQQIALCDAYWFIWYHKFIELPMCYRFCEQAVLLVKPKYICIVWKHWCILIIQWHVE